LTLGYSASADVPGVRLVSVQTGRGAGDESRAPFPLARPGPDLDAGPDAFADTAAVLAACDLVVTDDGPVAHLAGALAVPVWVALPVGPDWRWLTDRSDTPWYPTMRLYRQSRRCDWSDVFAAAAAALQAESAARPARPALRAG
jgi:ADP-heptose:LPS heptosyltransferase